MENLTKVKNKQGGFLKIIILIVIALLLLNYYDVSLSEAVAWFERLLRNVVK